MRAATHAGSWYSSDPVELGKELGDHLQKAAAEKKPQRPARIVCSPHAGYRHCAKTGAYSYSALDPDTERVYVLGPSHHTRISGCRVTGFEKFETPFGPIAVDVPEIRRLGFPGLSSDVDEEEHSLEMCCPFISRVAPRAQIVPVIVGNVSDSQARECGRAIGRILSQDPKSAVVVSSDFCHWGSRFGYQFYDEQWAKAGDGTVSASIEALDKLGVRAISSLDPAAWTDYVERFENTVCGRMAILVAMHAARESGISFEVDLGNYSQSSKARTKFDSSVSYASVRFIPK